MSSVPEIPESPQNIIDGKLESGPQIEYCPEVKAEETENERSTEKADLLESEEKTSDALSDAEMKQDNGAETPGDDVLVEDMAPEPLTDKECGLQAKTENDSSVKKTHDMESISNVEFGPDTSSTEVSSVDKLAPVKIINMSMREFLEGRSEIEDEPIRSKRGRSADKVAIRDKPIYFGYPVSFPIGLSRLGVEGEVLSFIRKPETQKVSTSLPSIFADYTPPSESSSESESDTELETEQVDVHTHSTEDVKSFRTKLVENLSNLISREQESLLFGGKEDVNVLKVSALGYIAKRLKPRIAVERNIFRISLDVSRFSEEAISCRLVGNKIEVYARELKQNEYGHEMHEVHQVFKVPCNVKNDEFIAYIRNGLLCIEAPSSSNS